MKVHLGVNNIYATKRWPEPDIWGQHVTERWGLKYVQFCFDSLDPRSTMAARQKMCDEIKKASKKYGFEVHNCFIGNGAYTYSLLLHPFKELRDDALTWCELASETSEMMGARAVGGPIAAASVDQFKDEKSRARSMDIFIEGMQEWARIAARHKQEFLMWEPTPVSRELLIKMEEGPKLYERLNKDVPIPIHFLLDVGHQCGYEMKGIQRDTYKWIEELGKFSPVMHLQQMDGTADQHRSFTKEHNEHGVVKMEKVMEALEKTGLEEAYLYPEVITPFEHPEDKILEEMDENFEYLKQFVN